MSDLIQVRRDTAANWTTANPTLAAGEFGLTTDTGAVKIGDGVTAWSALPYLGSGSTTAGALKDFKTARRTSGDVAINSATLTNVDTALDLVLAAESGDTIECRLAARAQANSGVTYLVFDFQTIVAAAPVRSVSDEAAAGANVTRSHPGWATGNLSTTPSSLTGSKRFTVAPGDIETGQVRIRLRAFSGAAVTVSAADPVLYVEATNLGPQP